MRLLTRFVSEIGKQTIFAGQCLRAIVLDPKASLNPREITHQMYAVGVHSLLTTLTVGLFVGAIMAIQIYVQLRDFGAESFLGGLATSTTIRNVGPVLIAFMLSAKVGAYTSAELGTMKVTDQIDALRCLGIHPLKYLVIPRLIAVTLSSFLLLGVGLCVSILGGLLMANFRLNVNALNYIHNIETVVTHSSVAMGALKSLVFGLFIGVISCYRGLETKGGAEGVGNTVKQTAVEILVCIVVLDYSISFLWEYFYQVFGYDIL